MGGRHIPKHAEVNKWFAATINISKYHLKHIMLKTVDKISTYKNFPQKARGKATSMELRHRMCSWPLFSCTMRHAWQMLLASGWPEPSQKMSHAFHFPMSLHDVDSAVERDAMRHAARAAHRNPASFQVVWQGTLLVDVLLGCHTVAAHLDHLWLKNPGAMVQVYFFYNSGMVHAFFPS